MHSFYPPLSISAVFYGYLKLHRKERRENKDLRSHLRESNLGSSTKNAAHGTNCPNPCHFKENLLFVFPSPSSISRLFSVGSYIVSVVPNQIFVKYNLFK